LPTVFTYGHGDVIRGLEKQWRDGLSPCLERQGERIFGRGTADSKGQHSINLAAIAAAMAEQGGKRGFNSTVLIETSEEVGSPGLKEFCESYKELLKADVLLASDGPLLAPGRPTIVMGTRGAINFKITVDLREGSQRILSPRNGDKRRARHNTLCRIGPHGDPRGDGARPPLPLSNP
jgi:acetylornithine deacetylase/succinyl-diaminopimelate desuccinylase-like protein